MLRSWPSTRGLMVAAATASTLVTSAAAAEARHGLHPIPLPGGAAGLARAAGLDPALEPWRAVMEVIRRVHMTRDGGALLPQVRAHLLEAAGDEGAVVPSPLAPEVWAKSVLKVPAQPRELLAAILANRGASLLYHGLMGLDEQTRAFLVHHPETLREVERRHATAFALFGSSFRVVGADVAVPGGAAAAAAWERVVGRSPARPEEFLVTLLGRDDGRLAYLYDSLAQLEPSRLRFALGLDLDPARRERRLRALNRSVARTEPWWQEGRSLRPEVDASRVLREAQVRGAELAPPAGRALWDAVFAEGPLAPTGAHGARDDPVDAAWLVEHVAGAPRAPLERLSAFAFAQRTLGGADPRSPELLLSLRGFLRYPALLLTLERIGVHDAGLLAAGVRRAYQLSSYPDPRRAAVAVAQFQGALGLLDRACFTGALEAPVARRLVRSLVDIQPMGANRYYGRIARFIDEDLVPALAGGGPPEERLSRALAGSAAMDRVSWRGTSYRFDAGGIERERLARAQSRLGGNPLDHVLDFCRTAAAVAAAPQTEAARRAHVLALEEAAQGLEPAGLRDLGPPVDAVALVAEARRLSEAEPLDGEGAPLLLAQPAIAAGEVLLAASLTTLLYAVHIGPAEGPALGAGDVAGRHDFGCLSPSPEERELAAWRLPRATEQRPWRLRGALLGLDVGLAPFALRRLSSQPPASAPALSFEADRVAFAQGVALMNPSALSDLTRDAVADGVRRGREQVARAGDDTAELDRLAARAGIAGWRRNVLSWLARHDAAQLPGFFTLAELRQLGATDSPGDVWGVPNVPADGLQPRLPAARSWDELLGHQGQLAPRIPDLNLRIAVALAERGLPARLAPALLAFAVQDLLDEAHPASPADGYSVARFARDLPPERIEAYLEALADHGMLRPVADASHEGASEAAP